MKEQYLTAKVEKQLYEQQLLVYADTKSKFESIENRLLITINLIKDIDSIATNIKQATIPLINYHASNYLNIMTEGVMSSIEVTDTYNMLVDDVSINLRSGGQKDVASLAFRLSLGQSIILGMLPLFIGDECDAAGGDSMTKNLADLFDTLEQPYQVILITHKSTANLEDCHIIDLG